MTGKTWEDTMPRARVLDSSSAEISSSPSRYRVMSSSSATTMPSTSESRTVCSRSEMLSGIGAFVATHLPGLVKKGGIGKEVGDPVKIMLFADGQFERGHAGSKAVVQLLEDIRKIGPVPVEFVHEYEARVSRVRPPLAR